MSGSRAAKISNGAPARDVGAALRTVPSTPQEVSRAVPPPHQSPLRERTTSAAFAQWVAWTAPGVLVSRAVVLGALIATPWLTTAVYVEEPVRHVAAALLLAHIVAARFVVRRAGRAVAAAVACGMLMADAALGGVLVGAAAEVDGPSVIVAVVVLAIAFHVAGWRALLVSGMGMATGIAMTAWAPLGTPLLFSPALSYATTLKVDTSFAGVPAIAATAPEFATVLDPDTSYAGASALSPPVYTFSSDLSVDTTFGGIPSAAYAAPPMVPAAALACIAVCLGGAVSLLRTRRGVRVARRSAV